MAISGAKAAGVTVIRGAQGKVLPLLEVSPRAIAPYTALALGQVTTDVGPVCPPECLDAIRQAMSKRFTDEKTQKHFPGGGRRLVVDVVCRYFQAKQFLGADPRLHLLAILKDGQSQEERGR